MKKGLLGPRNGATLSLLVCIGITGCKSGATAVVSDYLETKQCLQRSRYILEPERWKSAMQAHYTDQKDCALEHGKIDASNCEGAAVGGSCSVTVEKVGEICVVRTGDKEFKIDWPCTAGWNPVSAAVVKDKGLAAPTMLRVTMKLDPGTDDFFPKDDYFGSQMWIGKDITWAFSRREGQSGKDLYSTLQDGKAHYATVVVVSPGRGKVEIASASPGWWSVSEAEEQKRLAGARQYLRIRNCCESISKKYTEAMFGRGRVGALLPSEEKLPDRDKECRELLPAVLGGKADDAAVDAFLAAASRFDSESCVAPTPPRSAPPAPAASSSTAPDKPTCDTASLSRASIRFGAVTINGRLSADDVEGTVKSARAALLSCYDVGRCKDPKLEGRVAVRFVIGTDGTAVNIANASSDLADPSVMACVTRTFSSMKFPAPEGGVATVVYPMTFSPNNK